MNEQKQNNENQLMKFYRKLKVGMHQIILLKICQCTSKLTTEHAIPEMSEEIIFQDSNLNQQVLTQMVNDSSQYVGRTKTTY